KPRQGLPDRRKRPQGAREPPPPNPARGEREQTTEPQRAVAIRSVGGAVEISPRDEIARGPGKNRIDAILPWVVQAADAQHEQNRGPDADSRAPCVLTSTRLSVIRLHERLHKNEVCSVPKALSA